MSTLLDDVVEWQLTDGDEHAPADRPLRAVVQPAEALLPHHAEQAVEHVVVTGEGAVPESPKSSYFGFFKKNRWYNDNAVF